MSRNDTDIAIATCPLTVRERLIVDEMKAIAGLGSDANLVRAALFCFARQLHVEHVHYTDFGLRAPGRSTRVRRAG